MRAEGEAKSIELVAKAEAEAIRLVSESANKYFTENAQINKKLDVIRDTFSNATKIVVPSDSDVLNILGMDSGANVVPIIRKGEGEKQKSTL